jgi:hypothetical protein
MIPEAYQGAKRVRYRKALVEVKEKNVLANPDRINVTRKSFIKSEPLYKLKPCGFAGDNKLLEVAFRVI